MVYRVVIYGWAIPEDRFLGKGSGTLVDLTYFCYEPVDVADLFNVIENSGFKIFAKHIDNIKNNPVEMDRISVDEMKIGVDQYQYSGEYEQ
jgi:hypothetical protein